MPVLDAVRTPWSFTLTTGEHDLIFYSMVVAGLALFAQFVRTWVSVGEIGSRYRSAVYATLAVCGVAFLAYVYLVVKFDAAYVLTGGRYVPTAESVNTYIPRYMDWSVTVPLLMVELLAVGALTGARARSTRFVLMASAFLMIFTGFLGADVLGAGRSTGWLLLWGIISTVFYVVLYVVLLGMMRSSKGKLGEQSYASFRNANILLLSVWGWYPIAYLIHNWIPGAHATTVIQVGFSAADIAAKVGVGSLVHKVAKLRTAEDVVAGESTHPEEVWVSSVKHSDGLQPLLKGIADTAALRQLLAGHDGAPARPAPARVATDGDLPPHDGLTAEGPGATARRGERSRGPRGR